MAEHEPNQGASDEWYTPPWIFDALGLRFDLDPCSPGPGHWVPADHVYTRADDGLSKPWFGRVFMNPPYGGRYGHLPWLQRFLGCGDGIGCVRSYTSAGWFHDYIPSVHAILFPRGKTKFIRPDGSVGSSPGHGIVLLAMGRECVRALKHSGIGIFIQLKEYAPPYGVRVAPGINE